MKKPNAIADAIADKSFDFAVTIPLLGGVARSAGVVK